MNEFPYPSQQPTDNPLRRLRSSDTPPIPQRPDPARPGRQSEYLQPARPGRQSEYLQPARPAGPLRSPVWVRVVWNAWPGEIGGVGVWNADRELFTVVDELLDPRLPAADLVRAAVQVAVLHAGIPQPLAGWMGQAAKKWFLSLSEPGPDARKVQAVQAAVDLALSAENGSPTNSPALCETAVAETVNIVERLLGPSAPLPDELESFFRTFHESPEFFPPPAGPSPFGDGCS
jgi:hypothetical protein